ncbi:glycoside hydrolase family 73 protein [Acidocella sp.]|uniref:glycoside hydrolase family 73 protein n=1 Tax=Acidocella sp. TaxID=50710 RepID=UPI002624AF72|nr:glucosaminidase domain-containing protein [Acidocella sp.]
MMIIGHSTQSAAAARPGLKDTLEHLTGTLWYEMLSALNETGMDSSTLGAGGGNFQSMFLWDISQNDFAKYDTGLISAAMRQVGGQGAPAPAPPPTSTAAALAMSPGGAGGAEPGSSPAPPSAPAPDLVTQATNFAKSVWPKITAAASALGVPAVAVLAQTALETGWGAAAPGNNLFGIKASGGETGTARATHEMVDGVLTPQYASFRDYGDAGDSIADYVSLIQNAYQNAAGQGSVAGFAQALQAGGYATDQNYAAKIVKIAQSPVMAAVLQAIGANPDSGVLP